MTAFNLVRSLLLGVLAAAACSLIGAKQSVGYDPLEVSVANAAETLELTVRDAPGQRKIPLLVYIPNASGPAPVLLFSHGLGGARYGSAFLGAHWAARGYVCVFLQHPGSDDAVWKEVPVAARMAALRHAANVHNTLLRLRDIPAVIDQLERWNEDGTHSLGGRLNMKRIGMAGHSFGALTTQAVSGQRVALGGATFTDPRIRAAVVMSPSASFQSSTPAAHAFGAVAIPWMLMTGTKDLALVGDVNLASRLAVFPALPAGGKYELVLNQAEHSVFSDRALPGDSEKRNPNHQRAILALSTAFWDAWLLDDAGARAWLDGYGPSRLLDPSDRWQKK